MSESSSSTPRRTVDVRVSATERGTQLIVIDQAFNKVADGVDAIQLQLPAGLYKARFKAGNRSYDQLFEVGDKPVEVCGRELLFSSPVALARATNTHEYQHGPTENLLAGPPKLQIGVGAEIIIVARDSRHRIGDSYPGKLPWTGLYLRGIDGIDRIDFERDAQSMPAYGFSGVKAEASPGMYLLSQNDPAHEGLRVELPIALCGGWCTQVFLDTSTTGTFSNESVDLASAAIHMARMDAHVGLDSEMLRLTELARQALTRGESAVSDREISDMADGKFEWPMLGLYAIHTLLARKTVDWDQLAVLAFNLDALLVTGHPDVRVLVAAAAHHHRGAGLPGPPPDLWPPMFDASWRLAMTHNLAATRDEVLAETLDQYRVTGSIWSLMRRPVTGARSPFSFALGAAPVFQPENFQQLQDDVADHWRELANGLRKANPKHSPFQQTLRRRLLELSKHDGGSLPDLQALAHQFRLPPRVASLAYVELRTEAGLAPLQP